MAAGPLLSVGRTVEHIAVSSACLTVFRARNPDVVSSWARRAEIALVFVEVVVLVTVGALVVAGRVAVTVQAAGGASVTFT